MQPDNPPPMPPPYGAPTQQGQPPYAAPAYGAPTQQGQPPYAAPAYGAPTQQGQPPYAAAPPPYMTTTDEARAVRERKGKRDVGFGIVWIVAGLLITIVTMASNSRVYLVAWGPVAYGLFLVIRGAIAISRNRQ